MRSALRGLQRLPSHVGLAYEAWAPVGLVDGKVAPRVVSDGAAQWPERLRSIAVDDDYVQAFSRWRDSFGRDACVQPVETTSRLLVGHGNAAATDVGLTIHHTWGVPVIPGSALAGVTAHYVATELGAEHDPEPLRHELRGPKYDDNGVVIGPPGELYGRLFGVPEIAGQGAGRRGELVFCDALYVGGQPSLGLELDVLTVHQSDYYASAGKDPPTDHCDPIPVSFLTVGRSVQFLLAIEGPMALAELAMRLLLDALERHGVGGKTSVGYGRLRPVKEPASATATVAGREAQPPAVKRRPPEPGPELQAFLAWLDQRLEGEVQRTVLADVEVSWRERIGAASLEERVRGARALRKRITNRKLLPRLDALCRAIEA